MKTIITITIICMAISFTTAQIAIGKSAPVAGAILDFVDGAENKGIALPKITSLASSTPGTLYFDVTDNKVYLIDNNTTEFDLSVEDVPAGERWDTNTHANQATNAYDNDYDDYTPLAEEATVNGMVIGAETSSVIGVLVLESTDKALVLPKVANPHTTIIDPEPGMIVFDTTKKMLCVFNGYKWTFWGKEQ